MGEATARIGVDVGGTFTDFVLHDPRREVVATGKRLTTPGDPSEAIIAGIRRLLDETGLSPADLHSVVHGTTLVTNTVIERTGATVGLITTEGFRDAVEIGREIRYDLYDLFLEAPPTLVPRHRRRGVPERLDAGGEVLLPLDEDAVRGAARDLVEEEGVEALAISFLHAYREPRHERRAAEIVREAHPALPLSLSSEVAPEIREFERTSTACANAYVQPMMRRYLDRLEVALGAMGFAGRLHVMLSGGGIASVREAPARGARLRRGSTRPGRCSTWCPGRRAVRPTPWGGSWRGAFPRISASPLSWRTGRAPRARSATPPWRGRGRMGTPCCSRPTAPTRSRRTCTRTCPTTTSAPLSASAWSRTTRKRFACILPFR
jgi:hypothetical protein